MPVMKQVSLIPSPQIEKSSNLSGLHNLAQSPERNYGINPPSLSLTNPFIPFLLAWLTRAG